MANISTPRVRPTDARSIGYHRTADHALAFVMNLAQRDRARRRLGPALRWIVAGSLLLNVAGLWWGLPRSGWAPDELMPVGVLDALSLHFSHGWFTRYPPFHFYLLSVAYSPLLLLRALGRLDPLDPRPYLVLVVIGRLVTVAMSACTIVVICRCGARAFGRRAGLFAAAAFALVAPFVYYSKTANVDAPYLLWCALSMLFYVRLLDSLRLRDFVLFAVFATLAVCTKDQAYALYTLTPIVLLARLAWAKRDAGVLRAVWRAALDRRLIASAVTAAAVFALCHNLLFNRDGFIEPC